LRWTLHQDPAFYPSDDCEQRLGYSGGKNGLTLPRYQNWSLTFERELTRNMRVDISYIANRGTRLTADWQKMGIGANMNDPALLTKYPDILGKDINDPLVVAAGLLHLMPVLRELRRKHCDRSRNTRISSGEMFRLEAACNNALEVVVEQRVSRGLQFRVGYTYSRLNNDGSETGQGGDGTNGRVQNPACPHTCEWGLSQDDTPHVFLVGLPMNCLALRDLRAQPGRC